MLHTLLLGALPLALLSGSPDSIAAHPVAAAPAAGGGGPLAMADSIVLEKKARRLTLYRMGKPMRSYQVALGNAVGDKVSAGDRKTPEGLYAIEARNPHSAYHLSLQISYPDAAHRARAEALGVSPGGNIMIHGLPNGRGSVGAWHRNFDWTNGCVALTDEEIEEIWNVVPIGTPIEIKP
ncbi:MAG TPA: L,D-transpeptidase family protein [Gemmatimonadaceae bacterium]|jgi:murein L,D-transpeptidase YafK